jgi:hypothetical protein
MPGRPWSARIADITSRPEYQNSVIQIRDPNRVTWVRDIVAGTSTHVGDPVVWEGRARISSVRRTVDSNKGNLSNQTGMKPIQVQIPDVEHGGFSGRIERSWQIRVLDGGRASSLEGYLLVIESGWEPSNQGSRTLECTVDVETKPEWA